MHVDTLQLGEWTRVGSQLGVLSDNRVILPLSFRPDASTQFGALARVSASAMEPLQAAMWLSLMRIASSRP